MIQRMSLQLRVALGVIILAHLAISLVGLTRGGFWLWPVDLGRPTLLLVLAWLTWRGQTWARWALIVFLALSVLYFLSTLFSSTFRIHSPVIRVVAGLGAPLATLALITLFAARPTQPSPGPPG
jgi:hypothetical protein